MKIVGCFSVSGTLGASTLASESETVLVWEFLDTGTQGLGEDRSQVLLRKVYREF